MSAEAALPFTIGGARHPAASGSASTQNHRSPSDTVHLVRPYLLRHGVIVALDRVSWRRFPCDDRPIDRLCPSHSRDLLHRLPSTTCTRRCPARARRPRFGVRAAPDSTSAPANAAHAVDPPPQADPNPIGTGPPIACRDHRRCRGVVHQSGHSPLFVTAAPRVSASPGGTRTRAASHDSAPKPALPSGCRR
jgi:hypothetical protein